jgi:hypothetical protein
MVNQDLLIVFIALTSVAVLIQTGILVGFYFVTNKLSRQADRAIDVTRDLLAPVHHLAESLQGVSARIAEFGGAARGELRQFKYRWRGQLV